MSDHEEFFRKWGDCRLYDRLDSGFPIEDMYQAFKGRLISEVGVSSPELLNLGELVDVDQ